MNELESDKQNLKRWAHNFEKQKNESIFSVLTFFCKKKSKSDNEGNSYFKDPKSGEFGPQYLFGKFEPPKFPSTY